jgi:hypothetical protein
MSELKLRPPFARHAFCKLCKVVLSQLTNPLSVNRESDGLVVAVLRH